MAVQCSYCDGSHPWFQCPKKPDGWKPIERHLALPEVRVMKEALRASAEVVAEGEAAAPVSVAIYEAAARGNPDLLAPKGQCAWCDRRREYARKKMAERREKARLRSP